MVKLAQRYVRAAGSANLKCDDTHFDTDVLAAVALSSKFGGLLFRVKFFNDADSYRRLLHEWTWIVSAKALRRGWGTHIAINVVADESLRRWVDGKCKVCTGLGHHKLFNTPVLSDKPCRPCQGTGEAPLKCDRRLRDYILDMTEELDAMARKAGSRARDKLERIADSQQICG
jgi:hypothetical protein